MTVESMDTPASPISFGYTEKCWLTAVLTLLITFGDGFLLWKNIDQQPAPVVAPLRP